MSTPQFSSWGWDWEPSAVIGCVALLIVYAASVRFRFSGKAGYFVAGTYILLLALVSPIDMLAEHYLFSAHVLQHILLVLVVPPLWLMGIPREVAQDLLRWTFARSAERVLSTPVLAWAIGMGTIWVWYWTRLYNAALAHGPIHISEHLMLLVGSTVFWWPVLGPIEELRLDPLTDVIYIFAACAAHVALSIVIMFAPIGIYPAYSHPADPFHILPVLRDTWGLTPAVDREVGGLIMWVPACLLYLALLLATLARSYRTRNYDPFTASTVAPGTVLASKVEGEARRK